MVGVPGALSAAWLRLRALDGLLCRDLGDRLFQHTICLFSGLRLESSNSTALSALDVVSQRLATFVLGTDCRVVLACSSRFVTQARKLRQMRLQRMIFGHMRTPRSKNLVDSLSNTLAVL